MSAFDTEVSILSATIGTPSQEALDAGATPHLELGIIAGLMLPIPNPQSGQPLVIPHGKYRFNFSRDHAIEIFTAAVTAAETLPKAAAASGNVMVAQSMADVATAAENMKRFTGGQ